MKFKQYLNEITMPKKKWTSFTTSAVDTPTLQKLWDMYVNTYKKLGFNADSKEHFQKKYKTLWLIDIDKDDLPDAFLTYWDSKFGNKITALGTDNSPLAKKLLVKKLVSLVKKKGWFIEAGLKIADILKSSGVPIINDEEKVRKIIKGTTGADIEWIGDGEYRRTLFGTDMTIQERIFGHPK